MGPGRQIRSSVFLNYSAVIVACCTTNNSSAPLSLHKQTYCINKQTQMHKQAFKLQRAVYLGCLCSWAWHWFLLGAACWSLGELLAFPTASLWCSAETRPKEDQWRFHWSTREQEQNLLTHHLCCKFPLYQQVMSSKVQSSTFWPGLPRWSFPRKFIGKVCRTWISLSQNSQLKSNTGLKHQRLSSLFAGVAEEERPVKRHQRSTQEASELRITDCTVSQWRVVGHLCISRGGGAYRFGRPLVLM